MSSLTLLALLLVTTPTCIESEDEATSDALEGECPAKDQDEFERMFPSGSFNKTLSLQDMPALTEFYRVSWTRATNCSEGQFECGEYCIPDKFVCDGVPDCFNVSQIFILPCLKGLKILESMTKNDFILSSATDEVGCKEVPCGMKCSPNFADLKGEQFCVPFRQVCDTRPDCVTHEKLTSLLDGSEDEVGCHNLTRGHPSNAFRCKISGKVIRKQSICDFDYELWSYYDRVSDSTCSVLIADYDLSRLRTYNHSTYHSCLFKLAFGEKGYCEDEYISWRLESHLLKEKYSHCDTEPIEQPVRVKYIQQTLSPSSKVDFMLTLFYCYLKEQFKEGGRHRDLFQVEAEVDKIYLILRDHSDEDNCPDARFSQSIYPEKSTDCDDYLDCGDGTCARDRIECQDKYRENKCHPGAFHCYDRCVQPCDGRCDCWECEDEDECTKSEQGCLKNQFLCNSTQTCLMKNFFPNDTEACLAMELRVKRYVPYTSTGNAGHSRPMSFFLTLPCILLLNAFLIFAIDYCYYSHGRLF